MKKFIYFIQIFIIFFITIIYCNFNVSAYEIDTIESKFVYETLTIEEEVLIGNNNIYFDDVANPVSNPTYLIYYEFVDDDFTNIYENSTSLTLSQTRTVLSSYRNQLKNFYSSLKNEIIDDIPNNEIGLYYFSDYSPFAIRVVLDDEDLNQIIENAYIIASNEIIERVYVVQMEYVQTAYIGEYSETDRYSFNDALSDCGIVKDEFNGDDINVGIWESSAYRLCFNVYSSDFTNRNIICESNSGNYGVKYDDDGNIEQYIFNDHGTVVSTIATGNNGIANESNIFYSTIINLLQELDWFTINNVDVVNMSFGLGESYQFTYNGSNHTYTMYLHDYTLAESLIDFYSKYARITFVKSAGNCGDEDNQVFLSNVDRITTPGNALNIITVAATNYEGKVAKFSSYESFNDMKPNVVAPGASLSQISESCPNVDSNGITNTGTSFAAPIVTGVIALLMEEFPYLIGNPEAIIAVITASSKQLNTQSELWDSVSGPGLINYNEAREAAENFNRIIVEGEKQNNSIVYEQIINVNSSSIIEFGLCWSSELAIQEELQLTGSSNYDFNKYTIELYDNITGRFLERFSSNWNINIADYFNSSSNVNSIKIKVILSDTRLSTDNKDVLFLSYCQKEVVIEETLEFINKEINITDTISEETSLIYKINTNLSSQYIFELNSNKNLFVSLYDENMNLITDVFNINEDGGIYISEYLFNDYVYLKVQCSSIVESGDFSLFVRQETYKQVWFNSESDLLPYLHEHLNDLMAHGYYINYQNAGFYEVELYAENSDGQIYDLPYGAITIKDNNDEYIINKYEFDEFSTVAKNSDGNNSLIVYLPRSGYFYFHISLPLDDYTNLKIKIKPIENESINIFELPENMNDELDLITSSQNSDYIKRINLNQAGKFTINFENSVEPDNNLLFVVAKLNYNNVTQRYSLETILAELADNLSSQFDLKLEEGIYYIGYFNNDINNIINVKLDRIITQYGSAPLISDPDYGTDGGSQVNIYEKNLLPSDRSYRGINIVIGFTRVIYIDYYYVDQYSRDDYYWYSSNDSIATVSQHGTVFGKSAGTVKIMAVNKDDPSIVFVKQFTVVQDTKTYSEVVYSEFSDTHKLSDGEYQLGLDVQNSPYPMAQYYSWRVVSKSSTITSVSIDQWGNVTIVGTGSVVIEGYDYIYNDNYGVRINLTVTN